MRAVARACLPLLAAGLLLGGASGVRASIGEGVDQALQQFESSVDGFNLVTTGNATLDNFGDTEAGVAVGGNLTVTGGAIATQDANGSDPTLYVSGSLTLGGTTQLNSGYASLPGAGSSNYTWNATEHDLTATNGSGNLNTTNAGSGTYSNSSPLTNPGPAGWDWSTISSNLQSASSSLAAASVNGTISVASQNLQFTPNGTPAAGSVVVFELDASKLSGNTYNGQTISNVSINVPADVTYVINVINAGSATLFGSGVNFNSGSNDSSLIWNIEGSGSVTLGGGQFYGAVLAPAMNVSNTNNTVVVGQLAATSYTDTDAEMHFQDFVAAVAVPEPAGVALCAAALCGLSIAGRRYAARRRATSRA